MGETFPLLSNFGTLRGPYSELVGSPVVAVVSSLIDLGLLNSGILIPLSSSTLSVLLQVVVQDLGVGLLVWGQDVHEGGRGVARRCGGVDGAPTAQCRGQAERSCWCASMETLLLKRLCFCVNRT